MRFEAPAAALVALVALIGCAGAGSTGSPPCNDAPLAIAQVMPPAMLSPAPGATGLPRSVTVEISYDPPAGSLRAVAQGSDATVPGTPFAPAPTSTYPEAVTSTLAGLAPGTTYAIYVDAVYPPAPRCSFIGGYYGALSFAVGNLSTK